MIESQNSGPRSGWLALAAVLFLGAWALNAPMAQAQTNKAPVDVNSAGATALQSLPGVGPTLAQRIIDGRPYKNLSDLEKVKGLSKAKIAAFKDQVTFGPPASATTEKATKLDKTAKSAPPKKSAETAATGAQEKGAKTAPTALTPTGRTSGGLGPDQKININKASLEELDSLPGIGPAKAKAIIDYRNQNGPFKTIEDLQKVKGIKAGSFSKIKDHIKVTD